MKIQISTISIILAILLMLCGSASAATINVNSGESIQAAIDQVTTLSGDTILVAAGTYTENILINKQLTLKGIQVGIDARTRSGAESIINGAVTITSNDVIFDGFKVTNPTGSFGVYVNSVSTISVTNNIFDLIGTSQTPNKGSAQAIYIHTEGTDISGILVSKNKISNIGSPGLIHNGPSGSSAKGIYVGDTTGSGDISSLIISDNVISAVYASALPWVSGGGGGAGAYGIMINHALLSAGGQTISALVKDNSISNLNGLWDTAIGLEGNTPDASVTGNTISDPSAVGVKVEDNPSAVTVHINNNRFDSASYGVYNTMTSTVDAINNWWGSCDGPDLSPNPPTGIVAKVGAYITYNPWTNTCTASVPEFPTVALPIIVVIGLVFLFHRRKAN